LRGPQSQTRSTGANKPKAHLVMVNRLRLVDFRPQDVALEPPHAHVHTPSLPLSISISLLNLSPSLSPHFPCAHTFRSECAVVMGCRHPDATLEGVLANGTKVAIRLGYLEKPVFDSKTNTVSISSGYVCPLIPEL
jgi:hypothetical protein